MAQHDIRRIGIDLAEIEKDSDLSIAVSYDEANLRQVQALIVGSPETPYAYGFFEFQINFPPDYPSSPPTVVARTTNHGRCRFNPNIYANGRVCLSTLGTWPGEGGEEWSSAQTLGSILRTIQSIMSDNPYENEPGYEKCTGDIDVEIREAYRAKIRHENLRIAVIQKIESSLQIQREPVGNKTHKKQKSDTPIWNSPKYEGQNIKDATKDSMINKDGAFYDMEKRRFLWYYDNYRLTIEENIAKHTDGAPFEKMPFECSLNTMTGSFRYGDLKKRLEHIKMALDQEVESWRQEGLEAVAQDLTIAYSLRSQFRHFKIHQNQKGLHNIDVTLLDDNPFVWIITYFGRPSTNLEGGMFRIRLSLSPKFPLEQPRVKFETDIYHHRVSKQGVLCYSLEKMDEVKHHIDAIVLAIEEVSPPYNPVLIVHPEATKWYWGDEDEKKKYNRAQRRSAQASMMLE